MPDRIQLRRVKGWRLPENAVSVARPTKLTAFQVCDRPPDKFGVIAEQSKSRIAVGAECSAVPAGRVVVIIEKPLGASADRAAIIHLRPQFGTTLALPLGRAERERQR